MRERQKSSLHIAMIIDAWFPIHGGGQVHVEKLCERLIQEQGCTIDLYVRAIRDSSGKRWSDFETQHQGKLRIFRVGPCTRFFNPVGRVMWLLRVVPVVLSNHRRQRYDLIHAHAFLAAIPGKILRFLMRQPLVYTVHGTSLFYNQRGLAARIERWLLCGLKYDQEISVAHNFLALPNVNQTIAVIPNGVDLKEFKGIKESSNKKFTLLTMGRLDPIKGLHHLLEAIAQLSPERKRNSQLDIVGEGEQKEILREKIAALHLEKIVHLRGKLLGDARRKAFEDCHCFVLPSLSEGQPLTLLEAWAAKRPVLATSVGDNPRLVENHKNGILVPPDDVDALRRSIEEVQDLFEKNPERLKQWGQEGYNTVKQSFRWAMMAKKTHEIYERILSSR